jgi:hypothetical protein
VAGTGKIGKISLLLPCGSSALCRATCTLPSFCFTQPKVILSWLPIYRRPAGAPTPAEPVHATTGTIVVCAREGAHAIRHARPDAEHVVSTRRSAARRGACHGGMCLSRLISLTCLEHGHTDGDHVPEPCPACGLRVDGGGEVPQLALARSDRFVRVLSGLVVEQPTCSQIGESPF